LITLKNCLNSDQKVCQKTELRRKKLFSLKKEKVGETSSV
jgi:hypothetical protein